MADLTCCQDLRIAKSKHECRVCSCALTGVLGTLRALHPPKRLRLRIRSQIGGTRAKLKTGVTLLNASPFGRCNTARTSSGHECCTVRAGNTSRGLLSSTRGSSLPGSICCVHGFQPGLKVGFWLRRLQKHHAETGLVVVPTVVIRILISLSKASSNGSLGLRIGPGTHTSIVASIRVCYTELQP
jgi:hypothetical protein